MLVNFQSLHRICNFFYAGKNLCWVFIRRTKGWPYPHPSPCLWSGFCKECLTLYYDHWKFHFWPSLTFCFVWAIFGHLPFFTAIAWIISWLKCWCADAGMLICWCWCDDVLMCCNTATQVSAGREPPPNHGFAYFEFPPPIDNACINRTCS